MLPTPRNGMTLADKIAVNEILLSSGLDIAEMNRIRQHLSVLKGGGLLEIAHPAKVRSLIISDVVGDDVNIIASGPTAVFGGIKGDMDDAARRVLANIRSHPKAPRQLMIWGGETTVSLTGNDPGRRQRML